MPGTLFTVTGWGVACQISRHLDTRPIDEDAVGNTSMQALSQALLSG